MCVCVCVCVIRTCTFVSINIYVYRYLRGDTEARPLYIYILYMYNNVRIIHVYYYVCSAGARAFAIIFFFSSLLLFHLRGVTWERKTPIASSPPSCGKSFSDRDILGDTPYTRPRSGVYRYICCTLTSCRSVVYNVTW